jgi:hypothetical protein
MCTADPLKNRLFLATVTMPQQPVFRGAPGVEPGHSIRAHRTSAIASYRPEAGIPLGQTRTRRFHNHPFANRGLLAAFALKVVFSGCLSHYWKPASANIQQMAVFGGGRRLEEPAIGQIARATAGPEADSRDLLQKLPSADRAQLHRTCAHSP